MYDEFNVSVSEIVKLFYIHSIDIHSKILQLFTTFYFFLLMHSTFYSILIKTRFR